MEAELKSLVDTYAKFENELDVTKNAFSEEQFSRLERSFNLILNQWLLRDGAEKNCIELNYHKVLPIFDRSSTTPLLPEVIWLEKNLSQGRNDGTCTRNLIDCYQRLVAPENYKKLTFHDITTREDLKKWLTTLSLQARTYNEQSLYDSLLTLVQESEDYYNEVGKIKPKAIKALLSFFPVLLASMGTLVFVEELLAIYALYFIILKGGEFIGNTTILELQSFGGALQKVSTVTAATTTALLVKLMEMIFWSSRQCFMATLQIGSTLFVPLLPESTPISSESSLEHDLLKASENKNKGLVFNNYQLKLIAAPIETRCYLLAQQYFLRFRTGEEKARVLNRFLIKMREVDQNCDPIETKLETVQRLINKIKEHKTVYSEGGETWIAINKAENFLNFFKAKPLALLEYQSQDVLKEQPNESQALLLP